LTQEEAKNLARDEIMAFARNKRYVLNWVDNPSFSEGMRRGLEDLVLNAPDVRSGTDVLSVQELASQMDKLIKPLADAPTRRAQLEAYNEFSRHCNIAGLTRPEEQETLLTRALDTWAGGLDPQEAADLLPRLSQSLKHQHSALTRDIKEISIARAEAQS